jgi:long-chain acyl-CoA synthetase
MIDPRGYASLGELLRDACIQFKTHTALIEADRKRERARHRYLDLHHRAASLARRLQGLGIGAGDRVAIVMSNQSAWLITATAAYFRGAVLVPIDYKLSPEEQRTLLAHCRPKLLVTEYPAWRKLDSAPEAEHVLVTEAPDDADLGGAARWEDTPSTDPGSLELVHRDREDPAAIVYSSGTGGSPKGCVLTHGNYLEQFATLSRLFPLVSGDRYFSILPTNHAIDFMCGFIGPLAGGATVVHQRTLRPEFIRETMRRYRITHMAIVPLILEAFERTIREQLDKQPPAKQRLFEGLAALNSRLTAKRPRPELSRRLLKPVHDAFGGELRMLFCGGAFVDPERARFFYDLGIPVVIGYGLSEACTVVTVNDLKPFRPDTVGKPVPGTDVEIRDADPETGIGEVWVRGPTVMQGYLDDPEQTAEALVGGWLRTGDLGWMDASHHLHLVGRRKNMIVTPGGKNIYPEDIEIAFEGVPCDELVVFARDYVWSGGQLGAEELVAVVRGGNDEEVRAALRTRNHRLPDFKRISGIVRWSESFPRTASMKVKRHDLARSLAEQLDRDEAIEPL